MNRRSFAAAIGGLAASLAGAALADAQALPDCADLPNPVYLQIGDTQQPLIKELGRALRDNTTDVSLVYVTSGSCVNIEAIYTDVPITANLFYIPSATQDADWTPSDPPLQCKPPVEGVVPDIANSNVFVSACDPSAVPMGIGVFGGPIQAYVMAVPEDSSQVAITAEEAYFTFGFGEDGMVEPWNDESQLFIRTTTKSTLLSWAANIGVPAAQWKGQGCDKSTEVVTHLQTSTTPETAIGILGAEVYDRFRDTLDVLAFRAFDQDFAYYPDSTATAFDKQNVRDGHYTVWSPTVYLTRVDEDGVPVHPLADYVIKLILGLDDERPTDFDPLEVVVSQGLVPDCAMAVQRSFEGSNLEPYSPAEPCGCAYDALVGEAGDACTTCDDENPCATGECRHGYCEER